MAPTLYVVGIPLGNFDDATLRALRVLGEASLVVAGGVTQAHEFLAHHQLDRPLLTGSAIDPALDVLGCQDVALLCDGGSVGLSPAGRRLLRTAREREVPVQAVPGPSFPFTTLIASGLPADSFVYLGDLPSTANERQALLALVRHETRTLLARALGLDLAGVLADLSETMRDRTLVPVPRQLPSEAGGARWRSPWRCCSPRPQQAGTSWLFLAGQGKTLDGSRTSSKPGSEDCLQQGLRTKEISQQLAASSGWDPREIYRLVVRARRSGTNGVHGQ